MVLHSSQEPAEVPEQEQPEELHSSQEVAVNRKQELPEALHSSQESAVNRKQELPEELLPSQEQPVNRRQEPLVAGKQVQFLPHRSLIKSWLPEDNCSMSVDNM